jgi:flagellar biosynthetic protein FliR
MDQIEINLLASGLVLTAIISFARIGTAILTMPGFGDARVPSRIRLAVAFIISMSLVSTIPPTQNIDQISVLVGLLIFEITIGAFIGTGARLFFSSIHILGAKIGHSAGLSNAFAPNDGNFASASSISGMIYMGALSLMFSTNTHHLLIKGIMLSYDAIPIGTLPTLDMAEQIARIGADAFYISVYVGAPFLIFSVLFNLSLGLANRVMPSMQVFFVASPAMIILGLTILSVGLPMILYVINSELATWLQDFVR